GYVLRGGSIALEGAADELLGNPAVQEAYLGRKPRPPGSGSTIGGIR
ncbi:MAG: hypothetical protein JOY59_06775, partial [Candidatus Eremiobacteraeota bacterium]|nr:hypothetical protein [Candidatus Eremiobacteraeota bacterium]